MAKRTFDYSKFKLHDNNRAIDEGHVRRLKNSMKLDGFHSWRPIQVVKNPDVKGERYIIKQGHHRFLAARAAGVEIYYEVKKEDGVAPWKYDIGQKAYSFFQSLYCMAEAGLPEYQKALELQKASGMPTQPLIYALAIGDACSNDENIRTAFNSERFRINNDEHYVKLFRLMRNAKLGGFGQSRHVAFVKALSKVLQFGNQFGVDIERLNKQLRKHAKVMENVSLGKRTKDLVLEDLERVYNYKRSQMEIGSFASGLSKIRKCRMKNG